VSSSLTIHRIIGRIILILADVEKREGLEFIPQTGKCILTMNHLGAFDVPLVGVQLKRDDATFLATDKYKKNFFTRSIIEWLGGIWVNREDADRQALRAAKKALDKGYMLGIAPEGTRSPTHSLLKGKPGAAYLAAFTDAPILPVGITGPETAFSRLGRLKRARLGIAFGPVYKLPPLDRNDKEGSLQRNTDEIMCRIAALLPPEYRGVYQDHPRLLELLNAQQLTEKTGQLKA
jgi:1-acyl-sn-glycerol-3-phosphate acyltransferase